MSYVPSKGDRQALEALHTWKRLVELKLDPVIGQFDVAHLKEINRRIFQDLPRLGFSDVFPGEFRPPVAPGNDWMKTRSFETIDTRANVAYSRMDELARSRLNDILKGADHIALSKLDTPAFTKAMGKLYSELDYIHPFADGNSRTLREFTSQLAEASGYKLDWERFGQTPSGRDLLYISRDLSVNALALPHIVHAGTKRDVLLTMDQFEGNRAMADLLLDAVTPLNAMAVASPAMDAAKEHRNTTPFVEPSLEEQLREQEGAARQHRSTTAFVEPSLEDQLREQEGIAPLSRAIPEPYLKEQSREVERAQTIHSEHEHQYDEPGMDY